MRGRGESPRPLLLSTIQKTIEDEHDIGDHGLAIGFIAGYGHPAVHSPVIVASTSLLVVGIGGLLSLRVPGWWFALRGRSALQGWTDRLGAAFGLCSLAGVVIGGVAEFVHHPTRRSLNVVAVTLLAVGIGGWAKDCVLPWVCLSAS